MRLMSVINAPYDAKPGHPFSRFWLSRSCRGCWAMSNSKGRVHHSKVRSTLDLDTLPTEWDSDVTLRERMRSGGPILHPDSNGGEDIPTCVCNKELLLPLLTRMATSEKKSMPSIHDLLASVEGLLALNKRPPKPEDFDANMASAWRIRFLLGFIKMKTRRQEVSRVAWLGSVSGMQRCGRTKW